MIGRCMVTHVGVCGLMKNHTHDPHKDQDCSNSCDKAAETKLRRGKKVKAEAEGKGKGKSKAEEGKVKCRTDGGRQYRNPLEYAHPYPSMEEFAKFLALKYDANRTRHAYYRDMRLMHEHFETDPAQLIEEQVRDYFLHVKIDKQWKPKTIRQSVASAKGFFVEVMGQEQWQVFGQIRTKDHDDLPPVLSRDQVHDLLTHVRLRRYRTPLKLIYCCGLRLSECLSLTGA